MSKLSFRARALDASKPLPVFRCEDLPDLHEYASINRAVPQMPTGMEKEEESVCFLLPADWRWITLAVFSYRGAPLCCLRKLVQNGRHVLLFRAHDGSRRILNITTPLHHGCHYKVPAVRYFIREPCCVHLFHSDLHPKAQRSHVTRICSTILLTFSLVEASGDRPRTPCTFREQMPGGDTEPPSKPGLTARCCGLTAPALPCVLLAHCLHGMHRGNLLSLFNYNILGAYWVYVRACMVFNGFIHVLNMTPVCVKCIEDDDSSLGCCSHI